METGILKAVAWADIVICALLRGLPWAAVSAAAGAVIGIGIAAMKRRR